jgi:hypothetical protein
MKPANQTRRIRQLENCLKWVKLWCFCRGCDLNAAGADNDQNPEWLELCRLRSRIARTLPD